MAQVHRAQHLHAKLNHLQGSWAGTLRSAPSIELLYSHLIALRPPLGSTDKKATGERSGAGRKVLHLR